MRRWIPAVLVGSSIAALGLVATQPAHADDPAQKTITTEGIVRPGEEVGCLLLSPAPTQASGEPYLLVGGDRTLLKPGTRLRVTGILDPHLGGYCQQGIPLRVTTATPITP